MKKIYYICNNRLPTEKAHGLQIVKTCSSLAQLGVDLELIVPDVSNNLDEDIFKYYSLPINFKIRKVFCIDAVRWDRFLGPISFWIQTISFLISAKIYLGLNPGGAIYSREKITALFFKGAFIELHNLNTRMASFYTPLFSRCRGIVAISSGLRDDIIRLGIKDKVTVCPDGVDLDQFNSGTSKLEARMRLGIDKDIKIACYSGSIFRYNWKGVDDLIRSMKFLDSGIHVMLVGISDRERLTLEKFTYPREKLILIGQVENKDVPLYLASSDVLVLPNKSGNLVSERYTSPVKMFEYMASARPIVASDLQSIREVLDGDSAYFVKPNNPIDLARGINLLISRSDLGEMLAVNALKKVKMYSWSARARIILDLIA